MLQTLFLLLVGHALADYPLQGDFLSKAKNRAAPMPGVPFFQALGAHALIHGGFVAMITGVWWLGVAEAVAHAAIDDAKCTGKIGFNTDQVLHVACKLLWCQIMVGGIDLATGQVLLERSGFFVLGGVTVIAGLMIAGYVLARRAVRGF